MHTTPLLGGQLHWQPGAPAPSEEAFWLAASVPPIPAHTTVLDAACGNGAVGLALAARQPNIRLEGYDIQPARIAEAQQHAALNTTPATFTTLNILEAPPPRQFAVLLCNPPFHLRTQGHTAATAAKQLAHGLEDLNAWLATLHKLLQPQGSAYLALHAHLLPALQGYCRPHGGQLKTALLATHPTRPPKRLLAQWQPTGGQAFLATTAPLVPTYHTPLREAVLWRGQGLAALGYGW